jgi:hypothetical protein
MRLIDGSLTQRKKDYFLTNYLGIGNWDGMVLSFSGERVSMGGGLRGFLIWKKDFFSPPFF